MGEVRVCVDRHQPRHQASGQGSRTLDNFWVLIISGLAIVALFAIIFLVFFVNTPVAAS